MVLIKLSINFIKKSYYIKNINKKYYIKIKYSQIILNYKKKKHILHI